MAEFKVREVSDDEEEFNETPINEVEAEGLDTTINWKSPDDDSYDGNNLFSLIEYDEYCRLGKP